MSHTQALWGNGKELRPRLCALRWLEHFLVAFQLLTEADLGGVWVFECCFDLVFICWPINQTSVLPCDWMGCHMRKRKAHGRNWMIYKQYYITGILLPWGLLGDIWSMKHKSGKEVLPWQRRSLDVNDAHTEIVSSFTHSVFIVCCVSLIHGMG